RDIDPEQLPLDDPEVYELFCNGYTDGVFQFESDGMKNVLKQMQPSKITDLIAANAMYRPGPMELIPTYCHRKNGTETVPDVHPLVDDILAETYGIMTYQEQVMMVLNRLGKLPLNRALTLIKAISKKKEKVIAGEKPNFIVGCGENGIDEKHAEELFSLILKFAGYGFNKSHSTRYAIVAYQTAYFKVHYPQEFLAATLTFECGDTDKVVQYMAEARRMGIKVLPPDINTCGVDFAVDGDAVRFGLSAVKGVGPTAVEEIVRARKEAGGKFHDLYHFCEFADLRIVNRGAIESLIKCGAFDAMGATRSAMTAAADSAISFGSKAAADRKSGQMSFFGSGGLLRGKSDERPTFPNVEPWSKTQLLKAEKETLGFYVSDHPLVEYGRELSGLSYPPQISLGAIEPDEHNYRHDMRLRIGCMIQDVRTVLTKKDSRKMAMLTLEDTSGKLDAVVFPNTYEQLAGLIVKDELVFIIGQLDRTRERPQIIVDEIHPMNSALQDFTAGMTLTMPHNDKVAGESLLKILQNHKGHCEVRVKVRPSCRPDVMVLISLSSNLYVQPSRPLMKDLENFLDDQNLIELAPKPVPSGRQRKGFQRKSPQEQTGPVSEAVTRFN
ncbi:MAG TPA: DNA polymerase III subunit alpha, partial [Phycisphaerae bacterium]|nr:DNA polymerase III subunit alpha [Phycisphaerae bacterium]